MPSSLTRVLSSTLGYSPHPPVSVYGTVTRRTRIEAFLGSLITTSLCPYGLPITSRGRDLSDLPGRSPYRLRPSHPNDGWSSLLRPPIASLSLARWYRNIRLFSIAYASRPRLRVRLTLSGLTFLRKPWVFGGEVSRFSYRYSCPHTHFHFVHQALRPSFNLEWNAPLPDGSTVVAPNPKLRCRA